MNMTSAAKNTAAALACPYSECPLDILCSEQCAAEKPSMTNPRDDGAPIKSERQEAMAARAEVEDVVRCLREACAYINITEQVRGYHSAASNGLVVDAADLIDRLSRQLAEAQAVIERQKASWQPIETAPKDGTDFLMCHAETGDMMVVFYDEPSAEAPDHCWHRMDGLAYHRDLPTHWMPLPEPPP